MEKNTPYVKKYDVDGNLVNPISSYSQDGYLSNSPNRSQRRAYARTMASGLKFNNRAGNRVTIVSSKTDEGVDVFFKLIKYTQRIGNKCIVHNKYVN